MNVIIFAFFLSEQESRTLALILTVLAAICVALCVVEMYWTAPEHLRQVGDLVKGTPKGDIYSFAIIMWEIMYNSKAGPYSDINLEPKG